jgi:molecular chaperone GrpE
VSDEQIEDAESETAQSEQPADDAATKLAEAQAEAQRNKDQLLRTAAEFDNYRKRQKREFDELKAFAAEKVLLQMIPVLDNLDRALAAVPDEKNDPLAKGVRMVAEQFRSVLEGQGVKRFETVGKPFDPSRHEAIQQKETDDAAPGIVLEEFQSGYLLGERIIRPAMVVVAIAPLN